MLTNSSLYFIIIFIQNIVQFLVFSTVFWQVHDCICFFLILLVIMSYNFNASVKWGIISFLQISEWQETSTRKNTIVMGHVVSCLYDGWLLRHWKTELSLLKQTSGTVLLNLINCFLLANNVSSLNVNSQTSWDSVKSQTAILKGQSLLHYAVFKVNWSSNVQRQNSRDKVQSFVTVCLHL